MFALRQTQGHFSTPIAAAKSLEQVKGHFRNLSAPERVEMVKKDWTLGLPFLISLRSINIPLFSNLSS
jgi:hypothetical protein